MTLPNYFATILKIFLKEEKTRWIQDKLKWHVIRDLPLEF